jgi:CARDB protein
MRTGRLCALVFMLVLLAPAAARADGPASVHLVRCKTGSDASDRVATYQAWMDAVPGSVRMALRFRLVARYPGHRPQPVADSKLRVWHHSHRGVTRYGYRQTVKELAAAGAYRTVVRYRWYDASGQVIRRAKRVSEACVQRGQLPNLVITGVDISRAPDGSSYRYGVSYANIGKGEADNFSVAVFVDGAMADSAQVASLGPGEGSTVYLNGPPCRRLRAVVDPDNTVPETNERDNSYRAVC